MTFAPVLIQLEAEEKKPLFFAVGKTPEVTAEIVDVVLETGGDIPLYQGPYEVEPKVEQGTVLQTKGKRMRENVVVDPIEITRVSNTAGGTTVYIGGIINA